MYTLNYLTGTVDKVGNGVQKDTLLDTKLRLDKLYPVQQIIPIFRRSVYGTTPSILHFTHETLLHVTYMEVLDFAEIHCEKIVKSLPPRWLLNLNINSGFLDKKS